MTGPMLAPGDRKVPWLSRCRSGWKFKPIKYLCRINAHALGEDTAPDTEIEYIDISSVESQGEWRASEPMLFGDAPSRARRIVRDGDVLISTVRTYLRAITHIPKSRANLICSTGFAVLTAGPTIVPRFLAYWVRSSDFVNEIVARSVGVSYPAINASDIGNLPFPLVDSAEQRAIAAFLDRETGRIDGLVAKKERQIELLQEKRAALVSHAVTKGLDPHANMKPSGIDWLGEIPAHWEVRGLKTGFSFRKGRDAQLLTAIFIADNPGDYPVYSGQTDNDGVMGHISSFAYDLPEVIFVTTVGAKAMTPMVISGRFSLSQNCLIMVPKSEAVSVRYFYYQLFPLFKSERASIPDHMQPSLRVSDLNKFVVAHPPHEEQAVIAGFVDQEARNIDRLVGKIRDSLAKLGEYRTALISAAVTGKIDVRGKAEGGGMKDERGWRQGGRGREKGGGRKDEG